MGWKPPPIENDAGRAVQILEQITQTLENIALWAQEELDAGFQLQIKAGLIAHAATTIDTAEAVARDLAGLLLQICVTCSDAGGPAALLRYKIEDFYIEPIHEHRRLRLGSAESGLQIH